MLRQSTDRLVSKLGKQEEGKVDRQWRNGDFATRGERAIV